MQVLVDYYKTKNFLIANGFSGDAGTFIREVHKRVRDKSGIVPIPEKFLKESGIDNSLVALVKDKNLIEIGKSAA